MGPDVDRPRSGPILVAGILVAAAAGGGIGEEDVERPVVPRGLGDEMADVGLLGDVAGHRDALDVLGDGFQAAGVPIGHDHALGAFLGVAPRDCLADAARRAGDDADLVFDFHFILPSPSNQQPHPEERTKCASRRVGNTHYVWRPSFETLAALAPQDEGGCVQPQLSSINSTYCAFVGWRGVDWWQ